MNKANNKLTRILKRFGSQWGISWQRRFADQLVLVLIGTIGPASFAAGWVLRGRFHQYAIRDAPLL